MKVRFADFELDTGARRLTRGGAEVHLTPKAFELLTALVERRPDALSKAQLHELLWPSTFVAESNLPALINEVRTALHDTAADSKFVRTVWRFGYVFCGQVIDEQAGTTAPVSGRNPTPSSGFTCWLILDTSRIELRQGENVVGRDPQAHAWIDLPTVSRRHARIVVSGAEARLEDLGSKNGTCLRGKRVEAAELLRDRDPILFGSVQVTFRAWSAPDDVETRTAAQS